MPNFPIHGYGISQIADALISAIRKQRQIQATQQEQQRREQLQLQETKRQEIRQDKQLEDVRGFKATGKMIDLYNNKTTPEAMKKQLIPYLNKAVPKYYGVPFNFDPYSDMTAKNQVTEALKTSLANDYEKLSTAVNSPNIDPKQTAEMLKEYGVKLNKYGMSGGDENIGTFYGARFKFLEEQNSKMIATQKSGFTGNVGQLEQAGRFAKQKGLQPRNVGELSQIIQAGAGKSTGSGSLENRAYEEWAQRPGNKGKSMEDFHWLWKSTEKEREIKRQKGFLPKIRKLPPEEAYSRGWKMNDDGTVFETVEGTPKHLSDFDKVLGKRGMTKAIIKSGEQFDDANELWDMLQKPEVANALRFAEKEGFWDRAAGSWSNRVKLWMKKQGYSEDSDVGTAISRMQRMASDDRKEYLGTAITVNELRSVQAWLPNAGDSYPAMLNKIKLIRQEGKQAFKRFLDVYKDNANMSPFYKAFGMSRFGDQRSMQLDAESLIKKYGQK